MSTTDTVSLHHTYPAGRHYVNRAMPRPEDAQRERERQATRFARFGTNGERDEPLAVVYVAGQAVTVRVEDGALVVDILVADADPGVFRIREDGLLPIRVDIEGHPVITPEGM